MENSSVPPTTTSGPKKMDTSKRVSCRATILCEWCQKEFVPNKHQRAFCSKACSAKARWQRKGFREKTVAAMQGAQSEASRRASSERMTKRNPMSDPAIREKARQSLLGKPFLHRGGNGKALPEPQRRLACALGWMTEFSVPTRPAKSQFQKIPNCYKVDIAHPGLKIAIEVDGRSHQATIGKRRDALKTEVLLLLGWSVLRFTNERVMSELSTVMMEIASFTTSKYLETTTTSQTV